MLHSFISIGSCVRCATIIQNELDGNKTYVLADYAELNLDSNILDLLYARLHPLNIQKIFFVLESIFVEGVLRNTARVKSVITRSGNLLQNVNFSDAEKLQHLAKVLGIKDVYFMCKEDFILENGVTSMCYLDADTNGTVSVFVCNPRNFDTMQCSAASILKCLPAFCSLNSVIECMDLIDINLQYVQDLNGITNVIDRRARYFLNLFMYVNAQDELDNSILFKFETLQHSSFLIDSSTLTQDVSEKITETIPIKEDLSIEEEQSSIGKLYNMTPKVSIVTVILSIAILAGSFFLKLQAKNIVAETVTLNEWYATACSTLHKQQLQFSNYSEQIQNNPITSTVKEIKNVVVSSEIGNMDYVLLQNNQLTVQITFKNKRTMKNYLNTRKEIYEVVDNKKIASKADNSASSVTYSFIFDLQ